MELVETLTAADWEAERAQLVSELDEARTALAEFEDAAAIALQRQVETAVEGIRRELAAECEQTRQLLTDTEEAAAIALERQVAAALEHSRNEWETERESLQSECSKLKAILEETSQSDERARTEKATECESLRAECLNLRTELNDASQSLAEIQESYRRELSEHKEDAAQRERLVQELHERNCNEQAAAGESLRAECLKLTTELNETRLMLAEMQEAYRRELSEHKNDDAKHERLAQELRETKALLAEKPAPSAAIEVIRMEFERVDGLMQELSRRIDDPDIELSEVMRKTVERSQLEAYLKGLSFSANL